MRNTSVSTLVICALLSAIGIAIPMFSPFKILLEPASFTLGSHVAIFIAMFISPVAALIVAFGTACGFFFGGFPLVVTFRALSHMVFAFIGALVLQKKPDILKSTGRTVVFSICVGIVHAVCELVVVAVFYFTGSMSQGYYVSGFVTSVLLLVGVGTVVHSMVDMGLALVVWAPIRKYNMHHMTTG